MSFFKFCPNCASQNIEFEKLRRFECFDCGMIYFHNVATAVAVIIEYDFNILFTIRNREPKLGMLDLPGGFTEPNESAEMTCQRELKEELGVEFNLHDFQYFQSQPNDYTYRGIPYKTEDLIFTLKLNSEIFIEIEKDEIQEVKWISKDEIKPADIGFDSLRRALVNYLGL